MDGQRGKDEQLHVESSGDTLHTPVVKCTVRVRQPHRQPHKQCYAGYTFPILASHTLCREKGRFLTPNSLHERVSGKGDVHLTPTRVRAEGQGEGCIHSSDASIGDMMSTFVNINS